MLTGPSWRRWLTQSPDGYLWDNVVLNPGVGGSTAAADDIGGGVLAQRIKLITGADGVNDGDVAKGNPLPVKAIGSVSASTNVGENVASVALLAANANRLGWSVYNDSDAALNINFGAAATATAFVIRVLPRGFVSARDFGVAVYTGAINGMWDSAPGTAGHVSARTMELTP